MLAAAALPLDLEIYETSSCRAGCWLFSGFTLSEVGPDGRVEITWSIEGDLKDGVFTERKRVEHTRWKQGEKLPPHEHVESWARSASHVRELPNEISCGRTLDGGSFHDHAYVVDGKRIESGRGLIFVDGKELTRGALYGVIGHQLVAHSPPDADGFAEADVFDLRDGGHLRHLRFNLRRPLEL
jgi:hypothetical protein